MVASPESAGVANATPVSAKRFSRSEKDSQRFESARERSADSQAPADAARAGPANRTTRSSLNSIRKKHMPPTLTLKTVILTLLATLLIAPASKADDKAAHRLGDHPAVVVQRLQKTAGYDYASKFYPHPAGLRLYAQQPSDEAVLATMADAHGIRVTDAAARRPGTD
jgi:hypothetical protein